MGEVREGERELTGQETKETRSPPSEEELATRNCPKAAPCPGMLCLQRAPSFLAPSAHPKGSPGGPQPRPSVRVQQRRPDKAALLRDGFCSRG